MKFNLKNFPIKKEDMEKFGDTGVVDLSGTIFKKVSHWFLGFEKELREMKPTDEEFNEAQQLRDFEVAERDRIIDEILGDSE